jgi:hypothetical protein
MVPFFVDDAPYALSIVDNIGRLATGLRTTGGAVAWILPAGPPARQDFYGPLLRRSNPVAAPGHCGTDSGPPSTSTTATSSSRRPNANAARRDEDHNATLHIIYRSFGDVRTTDDLLELVHNS